MIYQRQIEQSIGNVLQYGIHGLQHTQYISIDEIATIISLPCIHYQNRSRNDLIRCANINFQSITTQIYIIFNVRTDKKKRILYRKYTFAVNVIITVRNLTRFWDA